MQTDLLFKLHNSKELAGKRRELGGDDINEEGIPTPWTHQMHRWDSADSDHRAHWTNQIQNPFPETTSVNFQLQAHKKIPKGLVTLTSNTFL